MIKFPKFPGYWIFWRHFSYLRERMIKKSDDNENIFKTDKDEDVITFRW